MIRGVAKIYDISIVMAVCVAMLASLFLLFASPLARAADVPQQNNNATRILEAFDQQQMERVNSDKLTDHKKHIIIFLLGAPLLIMLLITGGLGVAMGVYGKHQLFATHMLFAGLTITLALVHAVVSVVWFFPF
jgi:hypothetical protein